MKCLSAFDFICLIIAATFPGGQSRSHSRDIILLRKKYPDNKWRVDPFCYMTLIDNLHALSLAKCFVDKEIQNIQLVSTCMKDDGMLSTGNSISDVTGDRGTLSHSTFALVTLTTKVPDQSDKINPLIFPTQNDLNTLATGKDLVLYAFDIQYGHDMVNTPATYLSTSGNYIIVSTDKVDYKKYSWEGSPVYDGDKILAICQNHEGSYMRGTKVFCLNTVTVYQDFGLATINKDKRSPEGKGQSESSRSNKKQKKSSAGTSNQRKR